MGVGEKFRAFCEGLTIPADARQIIAKRCRGITWRLNKDFWDSESETSHSFYTGSYGRGTATRGCSDIDLIMELPVAVYNRYKAYTSNGPSALLQAVKRSIVTTYSTTDVGADGQVVLVTFSDGIHFEVVPGFPVQGGGYIFPDSNNGGMWRFTNPKPEIEAVREVNDITGGNLTNLARLVRRWRDQNGVYMGGLLVDTFCHRFLSDWSYRDKGYVYYDWMTRDFFKYLSELDDAQEYWMAPESGQRVNRKGPFRMKATTAYRNALKAVEYEAQGESEAADIYWRLIYGA